MVYVNGRFLTQPMTGVHRFAYELCLALHNIGFKFTVVMPNKEVQKCYQIEGLTIQKFGYGNGHLWEQFVLPIFFLLKREYLLINFTGLGPFFISHKIMTIHDLAYLENPAWYSRSYAVLYKKLTPLCAKTSKEILTVSEFSKKEIIKYFKIPKHKITVIYNAANIIENKQEESSLIHNLPTSFILAVSSMDPRKNLNRLINAMSTVSNCHLLIVGGGNRVFGSCDLSKINNNVIFLGRVSDDDLSFLYRKAIAFVYPSLYEGFGIPPIEAMSYGCPVIVSDIEVLHEVCGDAAIYVNPYDENDIADKITLLYESVPLQEELRKKGLENVKRFSWEVSATKLKAVLSEIAQ